VENTINALYQGTDDMVKLDYINDGHPKVVEEMEKLLKYLPESHHLMRQQLEESMMNDNPFEVTSEDIDLLSDADLSDPDE
jgi:hypothetical protein